MGDQATQAADFQDAFDAFYVNLQANNSDIYSRAASSAKDSARNAEDVCSKSAFAL